MPIVNIERILNDNPKKRLLIAFENLKANFSEESAIEYSEYYKKQSLSFILENSLYIFPEPVVGFAFYKCIIERAFLPFWAYEVEKEKIETYLEENETKLTDEQAVNTKDLIAILSAKLDENKNGVIMSTIISTYTDDDDKINMLCDQLFQREDDIESEDIFKLLTDISSNYAFCTYAPYVCYRCENGGLLITERLQQNIVDIRDDTPTDEIRKSLETILTIYRMSGDDVYMKAVSGINNMETKLLIKALKDFNLESSLQLLVSKPVAESVNFADAKTSIFSLLHEDAYYDVFKEDFSEEKRNIINARLTINEVYFEHMFADFENADYDNIMAAIFQESNELEYTLEAGGTPPPVIAKTTEIQRPNQKPSTKSSGKLEEPSENRVATKIQNKALDLDNKVKQKMASGKETTTAVKNAVKAVSKVPENFSKSIQAQVKQWDEMDDNRRKEYMIKPGFRKGIFRKVKLALLYGSISHIKLSLIPLTWLIRHFSKQKDIRIRKELEFELSTEIKVCEEKINDAQQSGDTEAKYQLIRIKEQLERERIRVKTNSKKM